MFNILSFISKNTLHCHFNFSLDRNNMNIYVGNLPWSIDDAALEQIFAEHGTITSAKVITDRQTNRSRGFGFVEMSDGGENAIQALNDAEVVGRKLVVNESRPRD